MPILHESLQRVLDEIETPLHIYLPPDYLVEQLGKLAGQELINGRYALAEQAVAVHDHALQRSVEIGGPVDIPAGIVMPAIVSQEVVASLAMRRRLAQRQLLRPSDPTKYLIVPRKEDIMRSGY